MPAHLCAPCIVRETSEKKVFPMQENDPPPSDEDGFDSEPPGPTHREPTAYATRGTSPEAQPADLSTPDPASGQFGPLPEGEPYDLAPPKRTNRLATAGCLSFLVPPLGLTLSIIGLIRSHDRGGTGRSPALAGIVLAFLAVSGYSFGIHKLVASTALDPGCISAETAMNSYLPTASADEQRMKNIKSTEAAHALLLSSVNGAEALESKIYESELEATHTTVRSQLTMVDGDLNEEIDDWVEIGNNNPVGGRDLLAHANQIQENATQLDSICNDYTNG